MQALDLPDGYTPCPGNRAPSVKRWGERVMVVLRNGIQSGPWPIATSRWVHDGTEGDIIGIKHTEETMAQKVGRQANGSYE